MKNLHIFIIVATLFSCSKDNAPGPPLNEKRYEFDDARSNASVLLTSDKAAAKGLGSAGSFYSIVKRTPTATMDSTTSFMLSDISTVAGTSLMVLKQIPNRTETVFYPSVLAYYTITANDIIYLGVENWTKTIELKGLDDTFYFKDNKGNMGKCIVRSFNQAVAFGGGNTYNVGFEIKVVKY